MLQRNVSLTWLTYVVVTMRGTGRLLDNHQIRGGKGQDVGEQTRHHNIPHNTGPSRVSDVCCYGTKHTSSPWALCDYRLVMAQINGVKASNAWVVVLLPFSLSCRTCNLAHVGFCVSFSLSNLKMKVIWIKDCCERKEITAVYFFIFGKIFFKWVVLSQMIMHNPSC